MRYPPIPPQQRGRLRWSNDQSQWVWADTGPYFRVVTLANGQWRVNRVRL